MEGFKCFRAGSRTSHHATSAFGPSFFMDLIMSGMASKHSLTSDSKSGDCEADRLVSPTS